MREKGRRLDGREKARGEGRELSDSQGSLNRGEGREGGASEKREQAYRRNVISPIHNSIANSPIIANPSPTLTRLLVKERSLPVEGKFSDQHGITHEGGEGRGEGSLGGPDVRELTVSDTVDVWDEEAACGI
jgi:hypothetical protein